VVLARDQDPGAGTSALLRLSHAYYMGRMRILLIGGTKFIGKAIARRALAEGHEVVLFNRQQTSPQTPLRTIQGDVERLPDFKADLLAFRPQVVVHCIAYTERHAADLVEVFRGTDAHVFVLSSQDCYDAFQQVVRGKEVSDFPINEQSALTPIEHYWRGIHDHEGGPDYDKNLVTRVVLGAAQENELRATVFRLPMVYGPEDRQYRSRHGTIIQRIADRRKLLALGQTEQSEIYTYGYVENVAAAVTHGFSRPVTVGRVYNLGEATYRTRRRWAELFAAQARRIT
jgi:nucleoside-diphosphate-sugar epimerase